MKIKIVLDECLDGSSPYSLLIEIGLIAE